jgi:hypothetical protein
LAYRRRRRVWHSEQWWFAIVNVVGALRDSADPRQYIKKMRSRDPAPDACYPKLDLLSINRSVDCHAGFTQIGIVLGPAFHRGVIPRERTAGESEICRLNTPIVYIQCMYDPV